MLKSTAKGLFLLAVGAALAGCGNTAPRSFSQIEMPSWSVMEIREGLDYSHAWDMAVEILVKDFELDSAIREEGYLRTGWLYTWSGDYLSCYRVRVTLKFSPDRTQLKFRPEAQFLKGKDWSVGTDTKLVTTMKTDLMGTIGRTTR
jgi:hypothetical protein